MCDNCRAQETQHNAGADRRDFLKTMALSATVLGVTAASTSAAEPEKGDGRTRLFQAAKPFRVQPVLVYHLYERKKDTTWRQWGGLETEADVVREEAKINAELDRMSEKAEFNLEIADVARVNSDENLKKALATDCDLFLVYASGAGGPGIYNFSWIEALVNSGTPNVMFLRHKSGPISLLYETVHPYFMRRGTDDFVQKNLTIDDVVVDKYDSVLWRLRAWRGLQSAKGAKIVAFGGPASGRLPHECPPSATEIWDLDIITVPDEELQGRVTKALRDPRVVEDAERQMEAYLKTGVVSVETKKEYLRNAFVLTAAMIEVMEEQGARAVTVKNCMNYGKGRAYDPLHGAEHDQRHRPDGVLRIGLFRDSRRHTLEQHFRQAGLLQRPDLPPRRRLHVRPLQLHAAARRGEPRTGQDPHPLRIGLRRRPQGPLHQGPADHQHRPRPSWATSGSPSPARSPTTPATTSAAPNSTARSTATGKNSSARCAASTGSPATATT